MKTITMWRRIADTHLDYIPGWLSRRNQWNPKKGCWELTPESKFHKKVMIIAGHWRFLGYDIIRHPHNKRRWEIYPAIEDPVHRRSLESCCSVLFGDYATLLREVVELEKERRGH